MKCGCIFSKKGARSMKSMEKTQQDSTQNSMKKISEVVEITQEHREALLTEYEMAHHYVWKWDSATWQSAAIFLSASLAGFVIIAQTSGYSYTKFLVVCITGISAILVLVGWLGMIKRWEGYKRVLFFRLREIEQDLELWENRYLEHLYNRITLKGQGLTIMSESDKARLQRLEQACPEFVGIKISSLIHITAIGIIVGWFGLLILEGIFTFAH
jgi:hypothetical protein